MLEKTLRSTFKDVRGINCCCSFIGWLNSSKSNCNEQIGPLFVVVHWFEWVFLSVHFNMMNNCKLKTKNWPENKILCCKASPKSPNPKYLLIYCIFWRKDFQIDHVECCNTVLYTLFSILFPYFSLFNLLLLYFIYCSLGCK